MVVNKNIVFNSVLWKFLERSSVQVVSFIVSVVLARLLTPNDYGSIALVLVFINIASVFVQGGFNTALIQKKNSDDIDYSTIFYFSLFVSFVLYLLLFYSAPAIASFYRKVELCSVLRVLGLSLFFNAINSVQGAYLSQKLLFRKLFYSSLCGVSCSAVIGIYMAYKGYGVWALVFQHLTSSFFITSVMWFTVKWRPKKVFSWKRFYSLFNYGWKIFSTNLTISIFINIRSLIIGKAYNASSLAYFDRGKQLPSLILDNIDASIQSVMFPVLSIEQENLVRVKTMMRRSIKVSTYVIFPLLTGLLVLANPIIEVLLTKKWIDAVPFVQIFCLAYMFIPMQNVNMVAIKALGHSGISLKLELLKKMLEVLILIVTIFISVKAVAWGIVVYNFCCIFINLYPCKKLIDYHYREQIKDVLPALALSVVMGGIVFTLHYLSLSPILQIFLSVLIGCFIYLSLSVLFQVNSYKYLFDLLKSKIIKTNH